MSIQKRKITSKALIIVLLGACFYFYDFVLQVSPSVMTHQLMAHFQINATTLGAIIGVYYYSYTAFQVPAGLLLDIFDAKKILFIVISCCSGGALLFALAPDIYMISLGRIMMGAGSAFAFLGALYLILRWLPPSVFALFVGFTQMLGSIGAAGGEAPFAFIINHIGWRYTMLSFAIIGFILAFLVLFFVKDPKLSQRQRKPNIRSALRLMKKNLTQVLAYPQSWAIALYALFIWAPIATFAALWGVPFLKSAHHLSTLQASEAISVIWIAMAIACPITGWLSDKLGQRCSLLAALGILGLIGISLVVYDSSLTMWELYACLALIGWSAAGQSLSFAAIKDNQPAHLTGAANGFNNMLIVVGGALFQPLVGFLLDWHWAGTLAHGTKVYTPADFHFALWLLPTFYIVATTIALLFIRETHGLSRQALFATTELSH